MSEDRINLTFCHFRNILFRVANTQLKVFPLSCPFGFSPSRPFAGAMHCLATGWFRKVLATRQQSNRPTLRDGVCASTPSCGSTFNDKRTRECVRCCETKTTGRKDTQERKKMVTQYDT